MAGHRRADGSVTQLAFLQGVKLIKVFLDPRGQAYLRTTSNPALKDQLTPVSTS